MYNLINKGESIYLYFSNYLNNYHNSAGILRKCFELLTESSAVSLNDDPLFLADSDHVFPHFLRIVSAKKGVVIFKVVLVTPENSQEEEVTSLSALKF